MAKADKKEASKQIGRMQTTADTQYGQGIGNAYNSLYGVPNPKTGERTGGLISDLGRERSNILSGYGDLANTGGLQEGEYNRLLSGDYSSIPGRGSQGVLGNIPNYLDVYNELLGRTGGFGADRLGRLGQVSQNLMSGGNYADVNKGISGLINARGNFGDVNDIISRLRDFGSTGGVSADEISRINRPYFEELERTGGYSPEDIANIRNRAARGAASTFGSLSDQLSRQRQVGNFGPGYSEAAAKLARQSAQATGENARDTELGISNAVREGKLTGAQNIAANQLALSRLKGENTLSAYGQAGNLGISRENAINNAMAEGARLGLSREDQIRLAQQAAADVDLRTQGLINQTRLGAAQGSQQETALQQRQRELDAENQRFLISNRLAGRSQGLSGLLSTYGTMPGQEAFYQNLLRDYIGGQTGANLGINAQRLNLASMPGTFSSILGGISSLAGGIGGAIPGLTGLFGGRRNSYGGSYGTNFGVPAAGDYMSSNWYNS